GGKGAGAQLRRGRRRKVEENCKYSHLSRGAQLRRGRRRKGEEIVNITNSVKSLLLSPSC
ncbi:MAG: hypothetical protein LBB12_01160, partial [Holosporaceae bacterium]|nr:hypothetical protein [Holosporaceae bacterium]